MKYPHERFEFSAMPSRPAWKLPKDARVAVYAVVNVEQWDIDRPVAREYVTSPAGVATVPNVPNWAWHEYGMRVGIWRLIDAFSQRKLKASAAINGAVCSGPDEAVAAGMRDAGWPFMGHGFAQAPMHTVDDQRAVIQDTFDALQAYTGKRPLGWLGPGLHETLDTLDYLAETGFRFVCDWPMDEHPVAMRTSGSDVYALPYTMELSDLPMMVVHQHTSDVWLRRVIDQFDRLYDEGATQPRVMSMSVHPYIMGTPHRIKYFEIALDYILGKQDVWFTTAEEIYDWTVSQPT
jgi:peptidoglycan/xylan/chitin deacetylase (PgdA/CDA1 family)